MRDIDRRAVLRAAAWSAPLLLVTAAVPAAVASPNPTIRTLTVTLVSTQLSAGGHALDLRDGKFFDSTAASDARRLERDSIWQVRPVFVVKDADTGAALAGATAFFDPGDKTDGQGNYVLAMTEVPAAGTAGNIVQSPVKRTYTGSTDATGQVAVRVATTTWSRQACTVEPVGSPLVPTAGTFSVTVTASGYQSATVSFSYLVYDGGTTVVC